MKTIWNFASDFVDLVAKQPIWFRWLFWIISILWFITNTIDLINHEVWEILTR